MRSRTSIVTDVLSMGIYDDDTPMSSSEPSTPSDNRDNIHIEEESMALSSKPTTKRLFAFLFNGTEKNGLLPPLSRSLDSGIDPLVRLNSDEVKTLATKANCFAEDAAWALEACKGDFQKAFACVSMAQKAPIKTKKGRSKLFDEEKERYNFEEAFSRVNAKEEVASFRQQLQKLNQKQKRDNYFSGGKADAEWLPLVNPKPIDEEPWFTG